MVIRKAEAEYHDKGEVRKAAKDVTMQASILGSQHIKSNVLRTKFVRDVDRWGQCLVDEFNSGKRSKNDVVRTFQQERHNLREQGSLITQKGIGFVAGAMMVIGSVATCVGSAATLCAISAPALAHGLNNMYESGKYFYDGDENATGPVRKAYQDIAATAGDIFADNGDKWKRYGDIAYYGVDLSMSGYGLLAKSGTLKPLSSSLLISGYKPINTVQSVQLTKSWTTYAKAKKFKLFRYSSEDYLRGYQAASIPSLTAEIFSDTFTLNSLHDETKHND
ncbi:DUF4225 domain-containing protein [Vibrio parahaemolyticus]|nr:DUF4225 domain-containing protein [Vibrio parahaemolyticus]